MIRYDIGRRPTSAGAGKIFPQGCAEMDDMRTRLSTLWIFVMFNMLAADILSFMKPEGLKELLTGYAGGVQITPSFLLMAAVMLEIPIAMIPLSRTLRRETNRWANIVAGIVTILFVTVGGSTDPHYLFIASIEVLCMALIVWYAWTWGRSRDQAAGGARPASR